MFKTAHIVGRMNPRWAMSPAYMHTFGNCHVFINFNLKTQKSVCYFNSVKSGVDFHSICHFLI